MSDPENIWLEPEGHEDPETGRCWCVHSLDCDECGAKSTQYVRADIVKKLEAENIELKRLLSVVDNTWWDTPYLMSKSDLRCQIQDAIGINNDRL